MLSPFHAISAEQGVGDFQNWAKTVEWDMKNIASALDYVQKSDAQGGDAGGSGFPAAGQTQ